MSTGRFLEPWRRLAPRMRPDSGGTDERGIVSLVVMMMMLAILLTVGLAYDGGKVLAAKVEAINEASEAARAGAQVLAPSLRAESSPLLDPGAATSAALAYLARSGHHGTVVVSGASVKVTVTFQQPLVLLGLAGLGPAQIVEASTATATTGIRSAGS